MMITPMELSLQNSQSLPRSRKLKDYVLMWPKESKNWPSTYSESKSVKWECDGSEADKLVVADYYRKSTKRVGTIHQCSSGIFFEKSLFEVLKDYNADYHKRDLPVKSRLDFIGEIGMDGYYLRFKSHRPNKEQTVIDLEKSEYEKVDDYEYDVKKIVLHEDSYKDMTSKFDLFSPINSFLEECLMVKREILEKFISLGATGFAWCEIENYTTELYEDLRDDETEPALKMEENVVEDIKLDITEKLKSNDIDVCLEADSKESLDSFKNSYSGKDLDNCVNQMYEDLLDNYTVASAVFQHWLNEEGDFDDEIHSEDWSDERQKELIKKYMDLELFTVGIYKGRVISFEVCLDDVSITAEIKEDGSFGDITTE